MKSAIIFFFSLLGIIVNVGYSQHYPYSHITLKEGLAQTAVLKIVQDHQGYLWMATGGGLCKYNGYEFTIFTYKSGLKASQVNDIEFDRNGDLWVGSYGKGLAKYTDNGFISYNSTNEFPYNNIKDLLFTRENELWIATYDSGIVRIIDLDKSLFQRFPSIPLLNRARKIIQLDNGEIIGALSNGFVRFSASDNYTPHMFPVSGGVTALAEFRNGFLIGGVSTIMHVLPDTVLDFSHWLPANISVRNFYADPLDHSLYVSTSKGILVIHGSQKRWIHTANGLSDEFVNEIFRDRFGNLYAATADNGVSLLHDKGFAHYDLHPNGGNLSVFSMVENFDKSVWIASQHHGILTPTENGLQHPEVEIPHNANIQQMLRGSDSAIYILADYKQVYRIRDNAVTWHWLKPDSIIGITMILPVNEDCLLMSTSSGAFYLQYPEQKLVPIADLPNAYYVFGFFDHNNDVWLTSDDGIICRLRDQKIDDFTENINPDKLIIKHSLFDPVHRLWWFCTEEGVLVWAGGDKSFHINSSNGLKSDLAYCITQDHLGRIWIGHLRGIECIDVENKRLRYFGYEQGFTPIETNGRAAMTDSHGNVWIGTIRSATKVNIDEIDRDNITGLLRMESIKVNEKVRFVESYRNEEVPHLKLNYSQNDLSFSFVSLCYENSSNVMYSWKLEGYDNHWTSRKNQREANYSALAPGSYTFRVRAVNPNGFQTNELVIPFTISIPFWKSAGFYVSEIVLFMLIVYLSFRFGRSATNRFGQIMILLTIIIIFESIMLFISRYTDPFTNDIPVFQLVMNVALALSLHPLERISQRIMLKIARSGRRKAGNVNEPYESPEAS